MLSGEQMSKGWPFSLLNDEQMSNWLGVEHQPVMFWNTFNFGGPKSDPTPMAWHGILPGYASIQDDENGHCHATFETQKSLSFTLFLL